MFKPVGDYMIVRVFEDTKAMVVMPDGAREREGAIFEVLAVGEGLLLNDGTLYKPDVEPGDKVCFIAKAVKLPSNAGGATLVPMSSIVAIEKALKPVPIPDKI